MLIDDSKAFGTSGWRVASVSTPALTLHAVFNQSHEPLAFGVSGEFDAPVVSTLIAAIESSDVPEQSGSAARLASMVRGFDHVAVVRGEDRHFLRGWADSEADVIHLIPVFECELTADGRLPTFERFKRNVNVFDLRRDPEPYFQFQMRGGRSQLRANRWEYASYCQLKQFAEILGKEKESMLVVQNRHRIELSLPHESGWNDAQQMIHTHLTAG